MSAELEARRTAAAAVLADYHRALHSAPLSSPPGREWMLRLADTLGGLLAALDQCNPDTGIAGRLAVLADGIDDRLANEHADRQTIAEDTADELRGLAAEIGEHT